MGRNMSAGLLTEINIRKNRAWYANENFDLKKEKNKIFEQLSKFVDITKYYVFEDEKGYCLKIKLDFINENIYDLVEEMNEMNSRINFINMIFDDRIECLDDNFKKEHPIKCYIDRDRKEFIIESDENCSYSDRLYYPFHWIISDEQLFKEISVNGSILPIWFDIGKFNGEDETFMLMAMNTMKTKYFKSELSKCLIFEIIG